MDYVSKVQSTYTYQPVFWGGVSFEFPQEILSKLRLRPNQKISRRQLWRALSAHAGFLLAREEDN
jgi:hypothetical protein